MVFFLVSKEGFIDRFNGSYDNLEGAYAYDYFLRFDDLSFQNKTRTLETAFSYGPFCNGVKSLDDFKADDEAIFVNLINASPHFDPYLKSSLLYFRNIGYGDLAGEPDAFAIKPFVETVLIYSNIQNGIGIFAAYNSTRVFIND